jgi:hypothetical protein
MASKKRLVFPESVALTVLLTQSLSLLLEGPETGAEHQGGGNRLPMRLLHCVGRLAFPTTRASRTTWGDPGPVFGGAVVAGHTDPDPVSLGVKDKVSNGKFAFLKLPKRYQWESS